YDLPRRHARRSAGCGGHCPPSAPERENEPIFSCRMTCEDGSATRDDRRGHAAALLPVAGWSQGSDETSEASVSDEPVLLIEDEAGGRTLTLNRPASYNSLTVALKDRLLAALRDAADDAAVRAVVLTGAGKAFCAGQDLKEH